MRLDWDSYFMKIADAVSERSTCDRAFVGCVLALDRCILNTGFNGSPAGQEHCDVIGRLMVEGTVSLPFMPRRMLSSGPCCMESPLGVQPAMSLTCAASAVPPTVPMKTP